MKLLTLLPTLICIGAVVGLASCSTAPPLSNAESTDPISTSTSISPVASETNTIVLGDISEKPVRVIERFQPLADYLATNLTEYGIEVGQVKVAPDLATMTEWITNGEVDLYFDSPYPALRISKETGATPILRRWKKGVAEYHSVFFTLTDSGINSVEDLNGHLLAFDSPYSTSGYMLPIVTLLESGVNPSPKETKEAVIANDEVGYIFTDDDDNTILWVLEGDVAAGVVDNKTFSDIAAANQENIRVLLETEAVPRHLAVASPTLDPSVLETLKTVLTEMDESSNGQAVLETFEKTAQFDQFPNPDDLTRLQELFERASTFQ